MRIIWSAEALREIQLIVDYINADDPTSALALAERILGVVETTLSDNPNLGRPGRVSGTRELVVHTSYLVAYQVGTDSVDILTVRHAARLWPESFSDHDD